MIFMPCCWLPERRYCLPAGFGWEHSGTDAALWNWAIPEALRPQDEHRHEIPAEIEMGQCAEQPDMDYGTSRKGPSVTEYPVVAPPSDVKPKSIITVC